ncbi:hypothetical protein [Curtobacterium sp. SL109]|uniref:hypothetical protein n=1 Tax=Curtobacterium sp. SL109 TaxID=2994662 RepID=UPI002274211E|nr:hypothetical protein [Curtobacterium sp. SL109]MCY1695000.1 hypothetical protein [Curtobacterium sp. SL109]
MNVTPARADLRIAVPVAVAWVVAAVLVGSTSAAWAVAAVAGGVLLTGTALLWVRPSGERVRVVAAFVVTSAAFVSLVAVAVAVGDPRRSPAALEALAGRSASVTVVLDRDLAGADRSVVATLRAAGAATGLDVPVRVVPAVDDDAPRQGSLGAGTTLTARAAIESDEAGSATAFVVFLRGPAATEPPTGLLALTDHARGAFATVTADLPQPGEHCSGGWRSATAAVWTRRPRPRWRPAP